MRINSYLIILIMFFFYQPTVALVCTDVFKKGTVRTQEIYRDFTYTLVRYPKSRKPEDIFTDYSKNDIIVGINAGHAYLMLNGYRYDGGFFLAITPGTIQKRKVLSPSALFRIKNAPDEVIDALFASLTSNKKPLSPVCTIGVCSLLRSSGIKAPYFRIDPSSLIEFMSGNGLHLKNGEVLEIDITVFGYTSMRKVFDLYNPPDAPNG